MPMTASARARAGAILLFINGITTLSRRTVTYLSSSSAEELAVQWLVEDDFGTAEDDEPSFCGKKIPNVSDSFFRKMRSEVQTSGAQASPSDDLQSDFFGPCASCVQRR
jgi:hypothetical protein